MDITPFVSTSTSIIYSINRPVVRICHEDSVFRHLENFRPTQRTTIDDIDDDDDDGVSKKFRRLENAARQIRPAAAFSYLPRAAALSPRNYVPRELNARQLLDGRR